MVHGLSFRVTFRPVTFIQILRSTSVTRSNVIMKIVKTRFIMATDLGQG